jgi:mutator protein MutT
MPTIEVAAGLIFRDGQLLITQRPPGAHLAGLWEFPGGKREPGEGLEDCLVRELREELGLEAEVGELIATVTHDYPEKTVHISFYRCRWLRHEPRPLQCADCRWIRPDALASHDFPAADTKILQRLRSDPGLWTRGMADS